MRVDYPGPMESGPPQPPLTGLAAVRDPEPEALGPLLPTPALRNGTRKEMCAVPACRFRGVHGRGQRQARHEACS